MPAPIINPAGPLTRDGKSVTNFLSDQAVVWAATGGALSNVLAQSVTWVAPNATGLWTVSGDNGPDAPTGVLVTVRAVIPNYWSFKNPVRARKEVQVFRPKYGPTQTRGFGLGELIHDWELSNPNNEVERFKELKAFYGYHHPGKLFDLIDPVLGERRVYLFDSELEYDYTPEGMISWRVRIAEQYPYVATPA
jgi:hypothetical protein